MARNMILLVHDCCTWPRTYPGCPVTRQNVSRVLGKALKIFATIVTLKTIVQYCALYATYCTLENSSLYTINKILITVDIS